MSALMAKCNLCGFLVPWDEIGRELMKAHVGEHAAVTVTGEEDG